MKSINSVVIRVGLACSLLTLGQSCATHSRSDFTVKTPNRTIPLDQAVKIAMEKAKVNNLNFELSASRYKQSWAITITSLPKAPDAFETVVVFDTGEILSPDNVESHKDYYLPSSE